MTTKEINHWLKRISYKPEFKIMLEPSFYIPIVNISLVRLVSDSRDSSKTIKVSQRIEISYQEINQMTFEEFVKRIQFAIEGFELHELKEWFKVDGKILHDPHEHERIIT